MSESAASFRPLNGAEEFDRRIRSIAQTPPGHSDALAELAMLVGQQDHFASPVPASPDHGDAVDRGGQPVALEAMRTDHDAADDEDVHQAVDAGPEPGAPTEPAVVHAPVPQPQAWERAVPRFPSISVRDLRPIEPSPDAWAQGADDGDLNHADLTATREAPPADTSSPKRTLVVLAAVVVLTAGGLAASFLARPSGSVVATATATPTIMAASGPSKVQPETSSSGPDAPSEPSTLLDKNKNDGTASATIVNSVEQPVDLGQAIKPSKVDVADEPAASPSPFPEPRKVKTVLVRPDGSIIADAPPAPVEAVPSTANQQASLAFDPKTSLPIAGAGTAAATAAPPAAVSADAVPPAPVDAPRATSGKTTTRATAPKPAASTTAEGSAAAQARTSDATPKAKPAARIAKPRAKPAAPTAADPVIASAAVADAAPTATIPEAAPAAGATGSGGGFAIQLGAAPTETEGQATAVRLGQKYAGDLDGATPSIHKAQANGKTVYRIRVGNLSQDAAKALCGKVKAGGGGCFVARN